MCNNHEDEDEYKNWRCRDRTKLYEKEITVAGCVTAQQHKLFLGDVVRVSAEITADVSFSASAFEFFEEIMSKFKTNKFELHKKLKKKGFVLQRIVQYRDGRTFLLFDVNSKSLRKLEEAIKHRSLGHLLLSTMTGKKDGNKVDDLELKLDKDDVNTAKNNISYSEEQSEKLHAIYHGRTLAKLKRTRSDDVQVEDNNPTFSSQRKQTPHGKENAPRIKKMRRNSLENGTRSRPILGNLENKK